MRKSRGPRAAARPHLRNKDGWELCDDADCEHMRQHARRFSARLAVAWGIFVAGCIVTLTFSPDGLSLRWAVTTLVPVLVLSAAVAIGPDIHPRL